MTDLPSVTVCLIQRNEQRYLLEWLAWYRVLGVSQFVVYDNQSDDGSSQFLMRLEDAGLLRRIFWPRLPRGWSPQAAAYNHYIEGFAGETDFVGFLDIDEFVAPRQHQTIPQMLAGLPASVGGLFLYWKNFGSSGHEDFDSQPVISRFRRCAAGNARINREGKSFLRARDVVRAGIHYSELIRGQYQIDTEKIKGCVNPVVSEREPSHQLAQINHYIIKSKQEYTEKISRGSAGRHSSSPLRAVDAFAKFDQNDEEDHIADRWQTEVLEELATLKSLLSGEPEGEIELVETYWNAVYGRVRSDRPVDIRLLINNRFEFFRPCRGPMNDGYRYFRFDLYQRPLNPGDEACFQLRGGGPVTWLKVDSPLQPDRPRRPPPGSANYQAD